jgi:hypothetical protein
MPTTQKRSLGNIASRFKIVASVVYRLKMDDILRWVDPPTHTKNLREAQYGVKGGNLSMIEII